MLAFLQDRPDKRELSTAKSVYAEEIVLHDDGREFMRIGRRHWKDRSTWIACVLEGS